MIEVEARGVLDKRSYERVESYLRANAESGESDNKIAYYYKISNGILKVVDEHSTGYSKLSLKVGNEYAGLGMEEYEMYLLDRAQLSLCREMLARIGYKPGAIIKQDRVNYRYKGVEIALKHTSSWGLHFEAEILVENQEDVSTARNVIQRVCRELEIVPFSEKELQEFIARLEAK